MIDAAKWNKVLSRIAFLFYAEHMIDQPEDATATIEELAREYHTSKTGIRRALAELEEHGFITAYVEEET